MGCFFYANGEISDITKHSPKATFAAEDAFENSKGEDYGSKSEVAMTREIGFVVSNDERDGHVIGLGAVTADGFLEKVTRMHVRQHTVLVDRHGNVRSGFGGRTAVRNPKVVAAPASVDVVVFE